jgi:hypothetical protein
MAAHAAGAFDGAMTRFKSFKKSVRDSFRRRRRTANRAAGVESPTPGKSAAGSVPTSPAKADATVDSPKKATSPGRHVRIEEPADDEVRPVERSIGARSEQSATLTLPSLVRTIRFARTFIVHNQCLSLWIGTNAGAVYIHIVEPAAIGETTETPPAPKDTTATAQTGGEEITPTIETTSTPVTAPAAFMKCTLAKEIHLRHGAPVLCIQVIDGEDNLVDSRTHHCDTKTEGVSITLLVINR